MSTLDLLLDRLVTGIRIQAGNTLIVRIPDFEHLSDAMIGLAQFGYEFSYKRVDTSHFLHITV